jgi:plasmid stabilization system protein ParE
MAFRVEFRPRAEQDLEALFRRLVQEAPLRGPQWLRGLESAIQSLRATPDRCPVYRQFSRPAAAVRRLLYGRYPHIYIRSTSRLSPTPCGYFTSATVHAANPNGQNSSSETRPGRCSRTVGAMVEGASYRPRSAVLAKSLRSSRMEFIMWDDRFRSSANWPRPASRTWTSCCCPAGTPSKILSNGGTGRVPVDDGGHAIWNTLSWMDTCGGRIGAFYVCGIKGVVKGLEDVIPKHGFYIDYSEAGYGSRTAHRSLPSRRRWCSSFPDCTRIITSRGIWIRSMRRMPRRCLQLLAEVSEDLREAAGRPLYVRVKEPEHAEDVAGFGPLGLWPRFWQHRRFRRRRQRG